jgi:hypothetical protein
MANLHFPIFASCEFRLRPIFDGEPQRYVPYGLARKRKVWLSICVIAPTSRMQQF